LYERLPEIYRLKDEEQTPPGQLKNYLAIAQYIFDAIHENIESLYNDLFIETCDDWVIPYIGDLLGTSHLKGDPWTLRADVRDTIALRRSKGTLASIERLTYNLTQWGVRAVELRENLAWNQNLNHQRPDIGGDPPYASATRFTPIRGGTVTLRDPAMLSLLNTPFDPFARIADLKPPSFGNIRYNLPNLAIFLWRLKDYRVKFSKPIVQIQATGTTNPQEATHIVRLYVHPLGDPVRLFNTYQFDPDRHPPIITQLDETPGPIPTARLTSNSEAGRPEKYVAIDTYNPNNNNITSRDLAEVGLQLHFPVPEFAGTNLSDWTIRGENLCAWENGIHPPLKNREIAIDPIIGRILIGVGTVDSDFGLTQANAIANHLLLTYTYGAVGPVGAHPISRTIPESWDDESVTVKLVNLFEGHTLNAALANIQTETSPVVIQIQDSLVHVLDLSAIAGTINEDGGFNLQLNRSLIIQAADGQRPIIKLVQPLRVRPQNVAAAGSLTLRLEGLYLTRDDVFPDNTPLIARVALNRLEIVDCTLNPGGQRLLDGTPDGTRQPLRHSLELRQPYGFSAVEEEAFQQTPEIILERTITGSLLIDRGYSLFLSHSLIDAGKGVNDNPETSFAVTNASDPLDDWGPPTQVNGITIFGRMRVERLSGRGGIWVQTLEVLNNQTGCIRYSYFSGKEDRLPQNLGCVTGTAAKLGFVSEIFGDPAYGQLTSATDFRIRERGPTDDAMGTYGFLLEAHKWRNLQIRFREFMPLGIRPLLIPLT
ncbi:MAG TPA: hypothetical protein DDZ80_10920, partial [Cyanobacteria bacterium UBA8803]|nr:hypothetical protein [Cyanobacteria bacterium UBA9273]HBL59004.1 hypothetical protein [Cyanobacteria bacterium UBA8803]